MLELNKIEKRSIVGVKYALLNYQSAKEIIISYAKSRKRLSVVHAASHSVIEAFLDKEHRYRLNHIDLVLPDSMWVTWTLNLIYHSKLKDRVTGPDLTQYLLQDCKKNKLRVLFITVKEETGIKIIKNIRMKYGLEVDYISILSQKEKINEGILNKEILNKIQAYKPNIIFFGLGAKKNEILCYETKFNCPVIGVGAVVDYLAGDLKRAPRWMQKCGLEWLFRFFQQPKHLWKRYFVYGPLYIMLVFAQICGVKFSEGLKPKEV